MRRLNQALEKQKLCDENAESCPGTNIELVCFVKVHAVSQDYYSTNALERILKPCYGIYQFRNKRLSANARHHVSEWSNDIIIAWLVGLHLIYDRR